MGGDRRVELERSVNLSAPPQMIPRARAAETERKAISCQYQFTNKCLTPPWERGGYLTRLVRFTVFTPAQYKRTKSWVPDSNPSPARFARITRKTSSAVPTGYTRNPKSESPIPAHAVSTCVHQFPILRAHTRTNGASEPKTGSPKIMASDRHRAAR